MHSTAPHEPSRDDSKRIGRVPRANLRWTMVVERVDVSGKWWPVAAPAILGAVCAVAGINLWNALLDPSAGMEEGTLAGDGARLLFGAFLLLNIGVLLSVLMPFSTHIRGRVLKTAVPTVIIGSILQLGILCCMFAYLIGWVGATTLWAEQKMEPERLGIWMGLGALVGLLFGYVSAYFVL